MRTASRFAGTVAGLALSATALAITPAVADDAPAPEQPAACAKEQKQLDKANDALTRVTAVFERQQEKVKKAKKHVKQADTAREERRAEKALEQAKDDRAEAKQIKRAQQQRVAKAQERLDQCEADQEQPVA